MRRWLLALALATAAAVQAAELPRKAQLGVQMEAATEGVRITATVPGLSAEALGLRVGDVIVQADGRPVRQVQQVVAWVGGKHGGELGQLTVQRGGERLQLQGTMIERPREVAGDYRVEYGHVHSAGARLRTIVTTPVRGDGRRAALLLVQGVTLSSVDFPLSADNAYAHIVGSSARGDFVTMRVDKPGVGDSEGGPASAVDFLRELDGYRQGLKALLARDDVDPERVFVFGHSMGGLWAPLLAAEFKLRGLIVAGTVYRTWMEYTLENTRRQSLLSGSSAEQVHEELQRLTPVMSAFLIEKLSPEFIRLRLPHLKDVVAESFSDGTYAGRALAFWHQVSDLNLPAAWDKVACDVLVLWGENDFLVNGLDHELIGRHLNARRAGSATVVRLARSDHAFLETASQADSLAHWGKPGPRLNRNVMQAIDAWLKPRAGRVVATMGG